MVPTLARCIRTLSPNMRYASRCVTACSGDSAWSLVANGSRVCLGISLAPCNPYAVPLLGIIHAICKNRASLTSENASTDRLASAFGIKLRRGHGSPWPESRVSSSQFFLGCVRDSLPHGFESLHSRIRCEGRGFVWAQDSRRLFDLRSGMALAASFGLALP